MSPIDLIMENHDVAENAGEMIADLLGLSQRPGGFYTTLRGPKTSAGLARCVALIIEQVTEHWREE